MHDASLEGSMEIQNGVQAGFFVLRATGMETLFNRIVEILPLPFSFSFFLATVRWINASARGRTVTSLSVPGTGDGLFLVVEPNVSSYEGLFRRSLLTGERLGI